MTENDWNTSEIDTTQQTSEDGKSTMTLSIEKTATTVSTESGKVHRPPIGNQGEEIREKIQPENYDVTALVIGEIGMIVYTPKDKDKSYQIRLTAPSGDEINVVGTPAENVDVL